MVLSLSRVSRPVLPVLRVIRSSNCGVRMSIVISRMRSDVLAPTLEALALLAGAATLIHALGVWARS